MARQLIEMLSGPFDPAQYRDDYREAVLALIERKVAGEEIAVAPEAPAPAAVPDLMAALQASVAAVGKYDERELGEGADGAKPQAQAARQQRASRRRSRRRSRDAGARRRPADELPVQARLRAHSRARGRASARAAPGGARGS